MLEGCAVFIVGSFALTRFRSIDSKGQDKRIAMGGYAGVQLPHGAEVYRTRAEPRRKR